MRRLLEWLYEKDHGQAQKDLRLPSVKFPTLTLGKLIEAFERAAQDQRYQALGFHLPRGVLRALRFVHDLRNELAHASVPEMEEDALRPFARQVRDGLLRILDLLRWGEERNWPRWPRRRATALGRTTGGMG